jgi:hypothetical protein
MLRVQVADFDVRVGHGFGNVPLPSRRYRPRAGPEQTRGSHADLNEFGWAQAFSRFKVQKGPCNDRHELQP